MSQFLNKALLSAALLAASATAPAQTEVPPSDPTASPPVMTDPSSEAQLLQEAEAAVGGEETAEDQEYAGLDRSPRKAKFGASIQISPVLMGLGLQVGRHMGRNFSIRGVANGLKIDKEIEEEDDEGNVTKYDGTFKLQTFGALVDWHPFAGAFRITGGLMANGNEIELNAKSTEGSIEIGNCRYSTSDPDDPLRVNGLVDFKSAAPYIGIGWGGHMYSEPGFFATFDLGVMLSGAPKAKLKADGTTTLVDGDAGECGAGTIDASEDEEIQQQLREAEADFEEETKDFKLWPNLAFGFGWRF